MKPLNHNLKVILTLGVPTAAALLGLLWLLKRKRDNDDRDESDAADTGRSLLGNPSPETTNATTLPEECHGCLTSKSEVNEIEKVVQDSGNTITQERCAMKTEEIHPGCILKTDSQQQLMNQNEEVLETVVTNIEKHTKSEFNPDLINSPNYVPRSASPSGLSFQSDDCQANQDSPAAQEMVEENSSEISQENLQPSLVNSAANNSSTAVISSDSLDWQESVVSDEFETVVQTTELMERTVQVILSSSSANSSLQPDSSESSLQSDPLESNHGSSQVLEKATEETSTVLCFSQGASSISSDSVAAVGHSDDSMGQSATKQDTPTADKTVSTVNISQNCVAPLQSSMASSDSNGNTDIQAFEESVVSESSQESGLICKDQVTEKVDRKNSSLTLCKQEQPFSNSQTSEPEQPALDTAERRSESQNANENRNSCNVETQESNWVTSVQDIPFNKFASYSSFFSDAGYCSSEVNSHMANETSVSTSISQDAEVEQNQSNIKAGATENIEVESDKEEAKGSNIKQTESNKDTKKEIVKEFDVKSCTMTPVLDSIKPKSDNLESSKSTLEQESDKSASSVILDASSSDSNSHSKIATAVTEATKATTEKVSSKVSKKKTVSKNLAEVSKDQKSKSASSPSKSSQSRPKSSSSSPSKSRQTSSKSASPSASASLPNNSYSSRRRNQSDTSDRIPDRDRVSRTSSDMLENGRMDSGSPTCDTNSEASNDSGRGGSVGDTLVSFPAGDTVHYDFNFPSELCGRLIGRGGKNIQFIKEQSGATVTLSSNPFTPEFQICRVQGMQVEVDQALTMIRKKFPISHYPRLDMVSLAPQPPAPVVLPEIMQHVLQMSLPEGVSIEVVVSAIVNAGHIFVQQPTHPDFPSLERLNHCMNVCYGDPNVPSLPRPVKRSIIVASESEGQWYRAMVMEVYPDEDECEVKYVDYGGYTRVPINSLKQIRTDFMILPFQAVECYLANITPLQEEENFSQRAYDVLSGLTSRQMLQGQVVMRGEDGVGFVHLYRVSGHSVLMINRELVNREVVRWIEIL